ncbi:sulfatase [Actinokineospora sp. HUAS TT18]|uniref:sulfatase n=1 Tax=Actinokineospora sp. HUAS TT18 TaxID=3447451 RepID=UPI003F5238E0
MNPRTPDLRRLAKIVRRPTVTAAACLFVLVVLAFPAEADSLTPGAFLRVPVEALAGAVVLLLAPDRVRRPLALAGGAALGLLAVVKLLDLGFDTVLGRPFDLVLDWPLLGPAVGYVRTTAGGAAAVGVVVAAVLVALLLVTLTAVSVLRAGSAVARHRTATLRVVAAFAVLAVASGALPVSANAAGTAYAHAQAVGTSLRDQERFAAEAAADAYRDTPGPGLLTALRGKTVIVAFVESYGRNAVEDPGVARTLDVGTQRLAASGYAARSGYLTSPTVGGGSWMAQATLLSGVRIDNQARYRALVSSDRLTLNHYFQRADWQTVGVAPGISEAWPEGNFFGYDRIYPEAGLGYRGPRFGFASMPDQYTLSAFQRLEGGAPTMATIALLSSHAPWSPIPRPVDWDAVGDGSVFATMPSGGQAAESIFKRDPAEVRADYARSVEYTVDTLVSYVEKYGDDDLVLVFAGDHQPAQLVTGPGATRDVPVTIVARDRAVLDRTAQWRWDAGLRPGQAAPVWPMEAFRDRFLAAFGPSIDETRPG